MTLKNLIHFYATVILSICILFIISTENKRNKLDKIKIVIYDTITVYDTTRQIMNDSMLIKEIHKLGIKFPHIVYRQALLESGFFKSKIFRFNNNLFGMKHPNKRTTISKGNINGYAYYSNWKESLIDYSLWQKSNFIDGTELDYFKLLRKSYDEDTNYIIKLMSINP